MRLKVSAKSRERLREAYKLNTKATEAMAEAADKCISKMRSLIQQGNENDPAEINSNNGGQSTCLRPDCPMADSNNHAK